MSWCRGSFCFFVWRNKSPNLNFTFFPCLMRAILLIRQVKAAVRNRGSQMALRDAAAGRSRLDVKLRIFDMLLVIYVYSGNYYCHQRLTCVQNVATHPHVLFHAMFVNLSVCCKSWLVSEQILIPVTFFTIFYISSNMLVSRRMHEFHSKSDKHLLPLFYRNTLGWLTSKNDHKKREESVCAGFWSFFTFSYPFWGKIRFFEKISVLQFFTN